MDLNESSHPSPPPNLLQQQELTDASSLTEAQPIGGPAALVEQTLLIARPVSRRQMRVLFSLGVGVGVMMALLAGSLSARSVVSALPHQPETAYQPTVMKLPRGIAAHPIPPLRLVTPGRTKIFMRKAESRPLRVIGPSGAGD